MRILTLNETGLVAGGRPMTHPTANLEAGPGSGGYGGYGGYGSYGNYGGMDFSSGSSGGGGTYNGLDVVDLPGVMVTASATDVANANGCISMPDAMVFGENIENVLFALGTAASGAAVMEAVSGPVANLIKSRPVVSAGALAIGGIYFKNVFFAPGRAAGLLAGSTFDAVLDITHGNQACIKYEAQ